jgi:hypothetical protein
MSAPALLDEEAAGIRPGRPWRYRWRREDIELAQRVRPPDSHTAGIAVRGSGKKLPEIECAGGAHDCTSNRASFSNVLHHFNGRQTVQPRTDQGGHTVLVEIADTMPLFPSGDHTMYPASLSMFVS